MFKFIRNLVKDIKENHIFIVRYQILWFSKKNHFIKRVKLLKDVFYSNSICGLLDGPSCQRKHANWINLIWNTDFNCYRTTGSPATNKLLQLRYNKRDRVSWKKVCEVA